MKTSKYFLAFCVLSIFAAHRVWASDINEIVYPPPEPEKMTSEDQGKTDNNTAGDVDVQKKKSGISDESNDKINKIYVYPDGRVLVPGTTPFEPVDAEKKKKSNNDDGYHNYRHHHPKPDYQIEPVLSEKKGRVKSKLGITGPGYIFVPAKESNGIGR